MTIKPIYSSVIIFIITCIIVFFISTFFAILLNSVMSKIHLRENPNGYLINHFSKSFGIWIIIILFIYLLKLFVSWFNDKFINYFYQDNILDKNQNTNEMINQLKLNNKNDILIIFAAIIPLIIWHQTEFKFDIDYIHNKLTN